MFSNLAALSLQLDCRRNWHNHGFSVTDGVYIDTEPQNGPQYTVILMNYSGIRVLLFRLLGSCHITTKLEKYRLLPVVP